MTKWEGQGGWGRGPGGNNESLDICSGGCTHTTQVFVLQVLHRRHVAAALGAQDASFNKTNGSPALDFRVSWQAQMEQTIQKQGS